MEDIEGRQWYQMFDTAQPDPENPNDITHEPTKMDDIVAIQKHFDETIKYLKY